MEVVSKKTAQLTTLEFIKIAQARVKVFVVEQNCPYQEIDEKDEVCTHVVLKEKNEITAYARIIDEGDYLVIGRVLVVKEYRAQKLGNTLLNTVLDEIKVNFPKKEIHISAQAHLERFYGQFGFKSVSDVYLEDDIPHIEMHLKEF